MVTNTVLLLACLATMLLALSGAIFLVDFVYDIVANSVQFGPLNLLQVFVSCISNLCFVVGIVMFLFNKRQGIIPIVICVFLQSVNSINGFASFGVVFIIVIIPAAVVVGSLFIRENGISAWKYMRNQSRLSSHKEIEK